MGGINKVILLGRVGQDAKFKAFGDGKGVIEFSIATSEKYKDKSGEFVEETTWHNCKKFGNVEKLAGYISKGDMLGVVGSIKEEQWEKDGETRRKSIIKVMEVEFCGGSKGSQSSGGSAPSTGGYGDDDIPF